MKKTIITLAAILTINPALAFTLSNEKWESFTVVDDFTDKISVGANISQLDEDNSVFLICKENEVMIAIPNGAYVSELETYSARIRVDKNELFNIKMARQENSSHHWSLDNTEWEKHLQSGKMAIIETKGREDSSKLIKFSLNNFSKAYQAVLKNCNSDNK